MSTQLDQAAGTVLRFLTSHTFGVAVVAAGLLVFLGWQVHRRTPHTRPVSGRTRRVSAEDALTITAAGIATAVAMTGMWRFFGVVLHFDGPTRILLFTFLELAVITSAVRAKRNMREFGSAGVDGAAMWVLTGLSAFLSSLAARSAAEALFRLAAPLVAAWLWHRGLALERRRSSGRVIHWRLTSERVLVRLGLADPTERDAGDLAAQRRLVVLARAAKRLHGLRARHARYTGRAERRVDSAMLRAVEYAALASDVDRQRSLMDHMGALYGASDLADLRPPVPWAGVLAGMPDLPDEVPDVPDDVPDPVSELIRRACNGVGLTRDEVEPFAEQLALRDVPGIARIREVLGCGQPRATRVRDKFRTLVG